MTSLTYSSKALDALQLFHQKRFVVYVEGPDDVVFWGMVLNVFVVTDCIIKPAGGRNELATYVKSIVEDNADIVAASDADYTEVLGQQINHNRIIYTYGHSIENSLYCPRSISLATTTYCRSQVSEENTTLWLNDFVQGFEALIVYEVANTKYAKGVAVLGDNCARFLDNNVLPSPAQERISKRAYEVGPHFDEVELENARSLVANWRKPLKYLIRGHFLTHAIMRFIEAKAHEVRKKKINISEENLFALMIGQFGSQCADQEDFQHLRQQVERLSAS